jgi:large subunit ribosomal protein L14
MIQLNSNLNVIDNSGAKIVRCIKVLNSTQYAFMGDIIIVSVRKAFPNKNIKVGEVHKALIVYTKKNTKRLNGSYIRLSRNTAVLLNSKKLPQATRILKPVPRELKFKDFSEILSIARKII